MKYRRLGYRRERCRSILGRRSFQLALAMTATLMLGCVWWVFGGPGPPPPPPLCKKRALPPPTFTVLNSSKTSPLPNPYNLSQLHPKDQETLIDLQNFTFLKNDPVCNQSSSPFFVVLVHTAPWHETEREFIRRTWGQSVHLVFLLGETNFPEIQESLFRENEEHHDLVQGNFFDSYKNLTYKHLLGLKWVTYYCPGAKYIVKIDDDVFVNSWSLREFLSSKLPPTGVQKLVLCHVLYCERVQREPGSKWRVSFSEYAQPTYPNFCMGWAIIYSPDMVFQLYREAQSSKYFWIDDVHLTGFLMQKMNLPHTDAGPLAVSDVNIYKDIVWKGEIDRVLFFLLPRNYYDELWDMMNPSAGLVSEETATSALSSISWFF